MILPQFHLRKHVTTITSSKCTSSSLFLSYAERFWRPIKSLYIKGCFKTFEGRYSFVLWRKILKVKSTDLCFFSGLGQAGSNRFRPVHIGNLLSIKRNALNFIRTDLKSIYDSDTSDTPNASTSNWNYFKSSVACILWSFLVTWHVTFEHWPWVYREYHRLNR